MHLLLKVFGGLIGQGHADAPAFRTYSLAEFERLVAVFTEKRFVTERHLPAGAGFMFARIPRALAAALRMGTFSRSPEGRLR